MAYVHTHLTMSWIQQHINQKNDVFTYQSPFPPLSSSSYGVVRGDVHKYTPSSSSLSGTKISPAVLFIIVILAVLFLYLAYCTCLLDFLSNNHLPLRRRPIRTDTRKFQALMPFRDNYNNYFTFMILARSGKTYTIGTNFRDGLQTELIPQAMRDLFNKIETLKNQNEFQLHVSFIGTIHKEEVRDLLDVSSGSKSEATNGHVGKITVPGKPPIQIREKSDGGITLAGSTEHSIGSLKEMADCLEQGSLSRELLAVRT